MWFVLVVIVVLYVLFAIRRSAEKKRQQEELRVKQFKQKSQQFILDKAKLDKANRLSQLEQAARIASDSVEIINHSYNVPTVIHRFNDLEKYCPILLSANPNELIELGVANVEEFLQSVNELLARRDAIIFLAIKRAFEHEVPSAIRLKTEKGRLNRITSFSRKLSLLDGLPSQAQEIIRICEEQSLRYVKDAPPREIDQVERELADCKERTGKNEL